MPTEIYIGLPFDPANPVYAPVPEKHSLVHTGQVKAPHYLRMVGADTTAMSRDREMVK